MLSFRHRSTSSLEVYEVPGVISATRVRIFWPSSSATTETLAVVKGQANPAASTIPPMIDAHAGKAECDRLGCGRPFASQARTSAQHAARIFGRIDLSTGALSGLAKALSSARSSLKWSSAKRERLRQSGVTLNPFEVTITVELFGAVNISLEPRIRSLHTGAETNASSAGEFSWPFILSRKITSCPVRFADVSAFLISSSSFALQPIGRSPNTGMITHAAKVVAPAPSAFLT